MILIPFRDRNVNSIVLLANGIAFAIQIVLFLGLGSFAGMLVLVILAELCAVQTIRLIWADFGKWRPNVLIGLSAGMTAVAFSWLGVHTLNKWESGAVLYILGCR